MRLRPAVLLALLCAWLPPAASAAPLTLTFETTGLTASGATASGEVAWLAVSRVPRQYLQEVSEVLNSVAADADGTAVLPLESPAPRRSLWVAVDLATGAFSVATPEDYPILEEALSSAQLSFDAQDQATGFLLGQQMAKILLVRPGAGAWSLDALDGTPEDTDLEVNGAVAVDLAALEPLGSAPPPAALQAGDVLVVIDPNRLSYSASTLSASLLAQGGN